GWDPVRMQEITYPGAVRILEGARRPFEVRGFREGEPAQVLECPVCQSLVSISHTNLPQEGKIHWVVHSRRPPSITTGTIKTGKLVCDKVEVTTLPRKGYYVLTVSFTRKAPATGEDVDDWWKNEFAPRLGRACTPQFARASRPGYFVRRWGVERLGVDFEIRCPNPKCDLNKIEWHERIPGVPTDLGEPFIPAPFEVSSKKGYSVGVPISAYTVDDQLYQRCPSMVIATVDKFARLAYEPR